MFRFVLFAAAFSLSAIDHEKTCPDGKPPYRATIRHIESGGIGYEQGYTTLEAFVAADPSWWAVTPFLDARGHVFDDGRWAANAGVGLRALWGNRVYGINGYYDYRNTSRLRVNQLGAGVETLGELFDFRLNGYMPIRNATSNPYDAVFTNFSGQSLMALQRFHMEPSVSLRAMSIRSTRG